APHMSLAFPGCCLCRLSLRTGIARVDFFTRSRFPTGRFALVDSGTSSRAWQQGARAANPASHLPSRRTDSRVTDDAGLLGAHDSTGDGSTGVKDSRGSRESRASLLAEVTALMGSGLEEGQLLFRLAHLVVPALGDLCGIDFFREPD